MLGVRGRSDWYQPMRRENVSGERGKRVHELCACLPQLVHDVTVEAKHLVLPLGDVPAEREDGELSTPGLAPQRVFWVGNSRGTSCEWIDRVEDLAYVPVPHLELVLVFDVGVLIFKSAVRARCLSEPACWCK